MAVAGEECSVRFSLKKSSSLAPLTSSTNLTCTSTEQAEVGEFYFETLRHMRSQRAQDTAHLPASIWWGTGEAERTQVCRVELRHEHCV